MRPTYITKIENVKELPPEQVAQLKAVTETYSFRANDYYLSLINWNDPDDPIRRVIVPDICEQQKWGSLDPSGEADFTVVPGLEHKYDSTALLLVNNVCGGICRYCFRKRVFINKGAEIIKDIPATMDYINKHEEITNVLVTGGDPMILATAKLESIIKPLCQIPHVKIIRIGTKMTAFNPYRFLEDKGISDMITACGDSGRQVYVMNHFNHPRELAPPAIKALKVLHKAGAVLTNQTPLIHGINDNVQVLAELFKQLSFASVPPYYVFQCRPSSGNRDYTVPVERGYQIFEQAKALVSGLAKRARFVMSHYSGKIEIVGLTKEHVYMKYHRSAQEYNCGRFMILPRNPKAYWLEDYEKPFTESVRNNTTKKIAFTE